MYSSVSHWIWFHSVFGCTENCKQNFALEINGTMFINVTVTNLFNWPNEITLGKVPPHSPHSTSRPGTMDGENAVHLPRLLLEGWVWKEPCYCYQLHRRSDKARRRYNDHHPLHWQNCRFPALFQRTLHIPNVLLLPQKEGRGTEWSETSLDWTDPRLLNIHGMAWTILVLLLKAWPSATSPTNELTCKFMTNLIESCSSIFWKLHPLLSPYWSCCCCSCRRVIWVFQQITVSAPGIFTRLSVIFLLLG